MLNFLNHKRQTTVSTPTLRVALIGNENFRLYVRQFLDDRIEVVAELASDLRVSHLTTVDPEVVILDYGSQSVNPLVALPQLAALAGSPFIVALTDNALAGRLPERILLDLGADTAIDIRDASELARAIKRAETWTDDDHPPVAA